jgi:formate hydrogenlyase subunit 6/NADH:ubiquinone oxidoreductase subunit I
MNIFRLILENLRRGTVSFPLPHKHECTSSEYRGLIQNDAARCVGCGSCAYVCPTAAIEVTRNGDTYRWTYDPGKCTFCARCIDRCRPKTLTQESMLPPLYSTEGELKKILDMVKKKPVRPVATPANAAVKAAETTPASPSAATVKEPVRLMPRAANPEPAV